MNSNSVKPTTKSYQGISPNQTPSFPKKSSRVYYTTLDNQLTKLKQIQAMNQNTYIHPSSFHTNITSYIDPFSKIEQLIEKNKSLEEELSEIKKKSAIILNGLQTERLNDIATNFRNYRLSKNLIAQIKKCAYRKKLIRLYIASHQIPKRRKLQQICFEALKKNSLIKKYIESRYKRNTLSIANICLAHWKEYTSIRGKVNKIVQHQRRLLMIQAITMIRKLCLNCKYSDMANVAKEYSIRKLATQSIRGFRKFLNLCRIKSNALAIKDKLGKNHIKCLRHKYMKKWVTMTKQTSFKHQAITLFISKKCRKENLLKAVHFLQISTIKQVLTNKRINDFSNNIKLKLIHSSFRYIRSLSIYDRENKYSVACTTINNQRKLEFINTLKYSSYRSKVLGSISIHRFVKIKECSIKSWRSFVMIQRTKHERNKEAHIYYYIKKKKQIMRAILFKAKLHQVLENYLSQRHIYHMQKIAITQLKSIKHSSNDFKSKFSEAKSVIRRLRLKRGLMKLKQRPKYKRFMSILHSIIKRKTNKLVFDCVKKCKGNVESESTISFQSKYKEIIDKISLKSTLHAPKPTESKVYKPFPNSTKPYNDTKLTVHNDAKVKGKEYSEFKAITQMDETLAMKHEIEKRLKRLEEEISTIKA